MDNLAYAAYEDEPWEELIDGRIVAMSPRPAVNHGTTASNIYRIFANYLDGKPCRPFDDGTDLYLTKKDHFIPDGMVVCDPDKVKWNRVEGAPDLVVEVLSPGSERRDRGHKKDVYERCGVKEYWIVSPGERNVEQYVLEDGKFTLREVYHHFLPYQVEDMDEKERADVVTEFRCTLFEDLSIPLADVFARVFPG